MTGTKFTFDTVFTSERDIVSDAAFSRRVRSLTEAEIEKLKAEAKAEGMKVGEVIALQALAHASREAAHAIQQAVQLMVKEREILLDQAALIAMALARKMAQTALSALPQSEVEAALRQAMHQAHGEPRLLLKASPQVVDALAGKLGEIAQEEGFEGRVQIASDPSLARADCRIEWRGGGAERAEAELEKALADIVARGVRPSDVNDEGAGHGRQ